MKEILTKTGKLGVEYRSCDRLYENRAQPPIQSASELVHDVTQLFLQAEQQGISRAVYRGLVQATTIQELSQGRHPLVERIEAVLPLTEDLMLLYLAKNSRERDKAAKPGSEIQSALSELKSPKHTPLDAINKVNANGYSFLDEIFPDTINQLVDLWQPTFGWEKGDVTMLKKRIDDEKTLPKDKKSVWITMAVRDQLVRSVAMAERLTLPLKEGAVDIVESCEWKTREGHTGQGLMTGVVAFQTAQIFSDLQNSGNRKPLIFAETNFSTKAYLAGNYAHFSTPQVKIGDRTVPQVLRQNVTVNSIMGDFIVQVCNEEAYGLFSL